jgi:hypothetical protein
MKKVYKNNSATLVKGAAYQVLYINNERVYKGDHLLLDRVFLILEESAPINKFYIKELTDEADSRYYSSATSEYPFYLNNYKESDFIN